MSWRPRSSSPGAAGSGTSKSSARSTPNLRTGTARCKACGFGFWVLVGGGRGGRRHPEPFTLSRPSYNAAQFPFFKELNMRVRYAIAIAATAALLAPASALQAQAQATPAPVLKKSAPPLRGTAELGFVQTAKLDGNSIVTTFQVKNLSRDECHRRAADYRVLVRQGGHAATRHRRPAASARAASAARSRDDHLRSPKVPGMTRHSTSSSRTTARSNPSS